MNICKNFSRQLATMKPSAFKPNILIASNEENVFRQLKTYFQELLGKTSYTIYSIPNKDLNDSNNNTAWRTNCVLLITTAGEKENELSSSQVYLDYMRQGGRILTIPADDRHLDLDIYRDENSIECVKIDSFIDQYSHKESQGRHLVLKVDFLIDVFLFCFIYLF